MDQSLERSVAAVRRFGRFYTQKIGLLHEGYLDSRFNLAQSRVLYELANRREPTASELAGDLALDPGYLSRILRGFEKDGLLARSPAPHDRRQSLLRLTAAGRRAFAPLDRRSRDDIGAMLKKLSAAERAELVAATATVERLLGPPADPRPAWLLRPPSPGDWGWIVSRHGAVYAEEYGWDETFEALVAGIVAQIVPALDPARERCWIAEKGGENVGSVLLVRKSARVAKLRLLLVERRARGHGIGKRLVEECVRFARQAGYRKITLWTNSVLVEARRLYAAAGVQVGSAMVATRVVVDETGPASLALLRYAIGVLCLAPAVWLAGEKLRFARRDLLPIALLGITQFGLLVAVLNIGLLYIPSGRAALLFASFPLMTLVLAAALGHERLGAARVGGVLLTILAVGLALGEKALDRGSDGAAWLGEAAVIGAAFLGALCSVLYRPYLRKYPALPVSAFAMFSSVLFLALLAAGEGFFAAPPTFSPAGWGAVLFIGLGSAVGYFLWLYALRHAAATEVTVFLSISPLTAILCGAAFLGEPVSPAILAAAALLGAGLWLASR